MFTVTQCVQDPVEIYLENTPLTGTLKNILGMICVSLTPTYAKSRHISRLAKNWFLLREER